MDMDKANLANLTGLWKKYGTRRINEGERPLLYANQQWPHRCWFEWGVDDRDHVMRGHFNHAAWLDAVPKSAIIALWPVSRGNAVSAEGRFIENRLLEQHWVCAFEQLAMCRQLDQEAIGRPLTRPGFQLRPALSFEDIKQWVDIGSTAFGYQIDCAVINNLICDKAIRLLLGWQDDQAVACALLYKTGDIIGLHQVAVKPAFQGRGIARCLMQEIIAASLSWQGTHVVLQASQAGQPLYESLGFTAQFSIKNYQRV